MVRNFWLSAWADENQQRQQIGAEGGNRTGSDFLDSEAFRLGVYAAFGIGEGGQWHPSFLYWVTISSWLWHFFLLWHSAHIFWHPLNFRVYHLSKA
jgi:hypothetical protein